MVFSSLPFLFVFFPITFILYYIVPKKAKNILLLIASLIFYAWGEPIYVFLMILTCLVGYITAIFMEKKPHISKQILIGTICFYILVLGFFKYANFLIDNINSIFNISINSLDLALPIGISFYTFQIMSYSMDVYRREVKPERNFWYFTTYVALFPQLIAGPIVRYQTISEELHKRQVTLEKFSQGFTRFIIGLGKKVLIANNIGMLYTSATSSQNLSVSLAWLGTIAFGLQIYFDFSGYSDMAIGMGKMLGFSFLENFNYPYIANSVTNFWRRWHMSLSTFFKDYVYIPLGGNKCNTARHIRNILVVWGLTGLWHGASWNFLLWGLYFGALLLIEKFFLKKYIEKLPNFIRIIYTNFLVLISWAIFSFEDMSSLGHWLKVLFGANAKFFTTETIYYIKNYFVILLIAIIGATPIAKMCYEKLSNKLCKNKYLSIAFDTISILFCVGILLLSVAYLVNATYNPFLYFRF